jgi:hypothetical protein
MPEPTQPAPDEATQRFEELWRQATKGPKTVEVTKTKHVEVDLSPLTILKYLREVADHSHAQGDIKEQDYKLIVDSSKQIEVAFSGLPIAKFYQNLAAVKDRLRAIREERGLDRP